MTRRIALPLVVVPLMLGCSGGGGVGGSAQVSKRTDLPPRALRDRALELLKQYATGTDPLLRVHALEALGQTLGAQAAPFFHDALTDPVPAVRFAACMAIGDCKSAESLRLVRLRAADHDPSVRVAAVYAMHRLGDTSKSSLLGNMIFHADPRVKAHAFMVLGLIGDDRSIPVVRWALTDEDTRVRWQAYEALARLGDGKIVEHLLSWATVGYADDRLLAILALGKARDVRAIEILRGQLEAELQEVRLAAARALGELGQEDGIAETRKGLTASIEPPANDNGTKPDPKAVRDSVIRLRSMACMAAGAIGRHELLANVGARLGDPEPRVRVAAAKAVLDILDKGPSKPPEEPGTGTLGPIDTQRGQYNPPPLRPDQRPPADSRRRDDREASDASGRVGPMDMREGANQPAR